MTKLQDITGSRFGRLVVIEFSHTNNRGRKYWRCRCDCGTEKAVASGSLKRGATRSCGCLIAEQRPTFNRKHGQSRGGIPEYRIWTGMRQRCKDPNSKSYDFYGGKGISVCPRWDDFSNFIEDMGRRPSDDYTLDRRDVFEGYSPENCRWVTLSVQAVNRRDTVFVDTPGGKRPLVEVCREAGVPYRRAYMRIKRGMGLIEAIS